MLDILIKAEGIFPCYYKKMVHERVDMTIIRNGQIINSSVWKVIRI